jgi:hypothetical protein
MRAAIGLLMLAGVAQAGEPVKFVPPEGWVMDAAKAKAIHAEIYAEDASAVMIGITMAKPMPKPDDAFVRGYVAGAQHKAPTMVEVRHDFPDIAGHRAARVIDDLTVNGVTKRQVSYVMPAGDVTAILLVTAAVDGFDARLGEFDAIAQATRGLRRSTDSDEDRAYRLGYAVGRVVGVLLVFVLLFFGVRAIMRSRKKA